MSQYRIQLSGHSCWAIVRNGMAVYTTTDRRDAEKRLRELQKKER